MSLTPLQKTKDLGTNFWNDSCDPEELSEAVKAGATGATSNPVIVHTVVKSHKAQLIPVLKNLIKEFPRATEDEIAWQLIGRLGVDAAALLNKTGDLSIQVNPKYYRNPDLMFEQGVELASIAPNIAIKAPCTKSGLETYKRLSDQGIRVNATVSFSVAQAVAAGEMIKDGYVTIMVGRLDDHLQRIAVKENIEISSEVMRWAGVAVFKKAHEIFKKRGFGATLLVAAYRHELHWSQLIGDKVLMTMPYIWWTKFNQSNTEVKKTISDPVDPKIIDLLISKFSDFRRAYDVNGLRPHEFETFGPTVHTLDQFLNGYQDLVVLVRSQMLES